MIEILPLASGSKGNCYHITDGSTPLLLECGIGINNILRNLKFGVSSLAGCLVSHGHKDHAKAVKDLMKFGIDIYLSQGTADEISGLGPWRHRITSSRQNSNLRLAHGRYFRLRPSMMRRNRSGFSWPIRPEISCFMRRIHITSGTGFGGLHI